MISYFSFCIVSTASLPQAQGAGKIMKKVLPMKTEAKKALSTQSLFLTCHQLTSCTEFQEAKEKWALLQHLQKYNFTEIIFTALHLPCQFELQLSFGFGDSIPTFQEMYLRFFQADCIYFHFLSVFELSEEFRVYPFWSSVMLADCCLHPLCRRESP